MECVWKHGAWKHLKIMAQLVVEPQAEEFKCEAICQNWIQTENINLGQDITRVANNLVLNEEK